MSRQQGMSKAAKNIPSLQAANSNINIGFNPLITTNFPVFYINSYMYKEIIVLVILRIVYIFVVIY